MRASPKLVGRASSRAETPQRSGPVEASTERTKRFHRFDPMNKREALDLLREYESRNVLFTEPDGSWPIVWERAKGVHVWDADGKKYLDLTAAFGVAAAGHANPRVVKAGQEQMEKLAHAMGDVHPHSRKAELARELSRITFERWSAELLKNPKIQTAKTIFCNS